MTNTRIILITGGSRGLGRASALALADAGDDIVLTYQTNAAAAAGVAGENRTRGRSAVALPLDTTKPETFAAVAEHNGEVPRSLWGREPFDDHANNHRTPGTTTP